MNERVRLSKELELLEFEAKCNAARQRLVRLRLGLAEARESEASDFYTHAKIKRLAWEWFGGEHE